MYEWNTGAEQTGVSSINEPIMIMSNAFLHNHEAGVDTYFWETPVCRKNWDATRTYVAAPEVPHVGGEGVALREARGKELALGDLGGRELGAQAAASCVTQSQD